MIRFCYSFSSLLIRSVYERVAIQCSRFTMSAPLSYEYLRPPAKAQFINHQRTTVMHAADYIMNVEGGEHKRRIFNLIDWMEYDGYEKQALQNFKKHLLAEGNDLIYDDALYLRFLYSGAFDLKECTRRLQVYDEWQRDPNIQNLSAKARTLL